MTTEAAPSIPAVVRTPAEKGSDRSLKRGPATLYSGCGSSIDFGEDFEFEPGEVFLPVVGRNVPRPGPSVPAGVELVGGQCLVAGDEQNIRIIYVLVLRTPSSGLNPESVRTKIVSYDPAEPGKPVATADWPVDIDPGTFEDLMPTRYGFMARSSGGIVGFDLNTLALAWRVNSAPERADMNYEGFMVSSKGGPDIGPFESVRHFHSAKDGAEITSFAGPSGFETFPHGFLATKGTHKDWQRMYLDMRTGAITGPFPEEGQIWGNKYMDYDIWSVEQAYIKVWNLETSQEIISRTGQDVVGLNIEDIYLAGDYLYIENDDDSPVIDINTLDQVSTGWSTRPVDVVGSDWLYVIDGPVTNGYARCFEVMRNICYETGKLVHAPGGNFPGPWF
ncbi:hypothetical protein JN086_07310 [Mycolicibacterium austroafricanum]|uniref:DUF4185 domain-containing protein n=1 Tax=Mycolicibacterium austroafricanum TaxID=39687 RepID=A0ABT8HKH5_MYCAO|nr:hypothetical protein [Mycolicibacterium austroafricanum]MDN4521256.1 hypothetical protein [Mycolicibacterium austroafricanum]QRZ08146.1 hypothetical protein JN090_06310 [Mycolicibacterium austroafricanum]QZT69810.1 hypothetical protein JN086_07310 [Mycolicibacterium austroafricanum]